MNGPGKALVLGMVLMIAILAHAETQKMSVQVRSGALRGSPSFLGPIVTSLAYGTRVEQLAQQGAWVKVKDDGGHTGWIHQSALTDKRIVLQPGAADVQAAASGDEVALAGKGFNEEVEAEFKAENQNIDFTWVDWMEKLVVTPQQCAAFLAEGDVQPASGGAS